MLSSRGSRTAGIRVRERAGTISTGSPEVTPLLRLIEPLGEDGGDSLNHGTHASFSTRTVTSRPTDSQSPLRSLSSGDVKIDVAALTAICTPSTPFATRALKLRGLRELPPGPNDGLQAQYGRLEEDFELLRLGERFPGCEDRPESLQRAVRDRLELLGPGDDFPRPDDHPLTFLLRAHIHPHRRPPLDFAQNLDSHVDVSYIYLVATNSVGARV